MQAKDPWCAATVTAVLLLNGYSDIAECSCVVMTKKAKDLGIWQENDGFMPNVGDIIMYDWQDSGHGDDTGTPDHVGIVIGVSENNFIVREGNKNKTIGNRTLMRNAKYIRGFITPPYEANLQGELVQVGNLPTEEEKPLETPHSVAETPYKIGCVYTIKVNTALNVRRGAGKNYGLVGYDNLTADGKKHATKSGALVNGTRVTVNGIKLVNDSVWLKIPSGWVCGREGNKVYVI
jgi:hypothetical protein